MATDFKLPDLGENIESGDVVNVLVSEGEEIQADQNVVELETDKATVEVPCPFAGRVTKVHVKPGDTVPVGGLLITVEATVAKPQSKAPKPTNQPPARQPAKRVEVEAVAGDEDREANGRATEPTPRSAPARPAAATDVKPAPPKPRSAAPAAPSAHGPSSNAGLPPLVGDPQADLVPHAPAGPATRRLARELGVDLQRIKGSGPDGRILHEDVVAAVRQATSAAATAPARGKAPARPPLPQGVEDQDAFGKVRREKMSKIRKTIATNMARSATTIPHVTNFDDADITELDEIRRESTADYLGANIKLTMMPFVMKAVAHCLKLHPLLNAVVDMDEQEIVYKEYINVGVAVDTDRGLVVPVVRNVDQLGIPQIAQALARVTDKARANQFTLDDLRGGTFTVSNLGAIGGTYSTPIINFPEVAVLLVGRSRQMPLVVGGEVKIRLMMPLSLSYDHRLIDGATAARFLNEVIAFLANPGRLLLAPVVG